MASLWLFLFAMWLPASAADYAQWKHTGSMWIVTTPDGANLPGTAAVNDFPLLVRLDKDDFDFSTAAANGADLRFSDSSGQPLAYQIDDWNAERGEASLWVRVPRIEGNAQQELKLYWGNPSAKSESSGKAVFNPSNGYLSVWHLGPEPLDEVGTLTCVDTGTTATQGMIGAARHFPGQKGIFGGDKIPNYPSGAGAHSSEAWFRANAPNTTILGWGNEGGNRGSKMRMQLRSPPHVHIDSDFADVDGQSKLPLGEWIHVVHTYDGQQGRLYINGQRDGNANVPQDIKSPARLWIGGWYNHYDFVGDIDEVRVSQVARSADWVRLQYENQKPLQTLVGPLVKSGNEFSLSEKKLTIPEGQTATVTTEAGGARQIYWSLHQGGTQTVVGTNRYKFTLPARRVTSDTAVLLRCSAVFADQVKSQVVPVKITESIPEPQVALAGPNHWNGRDTIEITVDILNLRSLQNSQADNLNYAWAVDGIAVNKQASGGRLFLKRAHKSGPMTVSLAVDNGGEVSHATKQIVVQEPAKDAWVARVSADDERPVDDQFFARDDQNEAILAYRGKLDAATDKVFLRVFADDKPFASAEAKPSADGVYALSVKLKPGLVKYRCEFGTQQGPKETILHAAKNLLCGDAYLINGQSNAVATDLGPDDPPISSEWVRSFGSASSDPAQARKAGWANAVARDRQGDRAQIGYWGMVLGMRLVESQKLPICILNGAVGGTRIDQHQRNVLDPTDATTIYGRLLWRTQQARLTHGVRGVLWHQGENDQGADGPTGGFGWETYRQYFIDLAAAWKEDYPNIRHFYVFQIWPRACAMGIDGSDNRLREVQRALPNYFSNLSVMSTLGIKPPGGCHYPIDGYAQFSNLIGPLVEYHQYHKMFGQSFTAPNLRRAYFSSAARDEVVLEFDNQVVWSAKLCDQFYLDAKARQVASGTVNGTELRLKLNEPTVARTITYLDGANWNPDNLLYGKNGIAALTFCDVPILPERPE